MVSLALAGIGVLLRDGVALTEGQLRTIGLYADADSEDLRFLYIALGLRESLADFSAQIGGRVALTL